MKIYEITFITTEDLKDKPIKAVLDGLGGKILNISSAGQKSFAYKIEKQDRGFYTTVVFELEPEKVVGLNNKLNLDNEILRHLLISAEHRPVEEKPKKIKEKTTEITEPLPTEITEPAPTEIIEEPVKEIEIAPVKPAKTAKIVKPKQKIVAKPTKESKAVKELTDEPVSEEERLEALDKKLEELLKE